MEKERSFQFLHPTTIAIYGGNNKTERFKTVLIVVITRFCFLRHIVGKNDITKQNIGKCS